MLVLWGTGQTSRYDSTAPDRLVPSSADVDLGTETSLAPKWQLDDSELWFGATADMIDILTASEAATAHTNSYLLIRSPNTIENIFFKLQAGVWRVSGEFMLIEGAGTAQVSRMFRVESDPDDTDIADSEPAISDTSNCPGSPIFSRNMIIPQTAPFVVSEEDIFYFMVGRLTHNGPVGTHWAGFEYLGTV